MMDDSHRNELSWPRIAALLTLLVGACILSFVAGRMTARPTNALNEDPVSQLTPHSPELKNSDANKSNASDSDRGSEIASLNAELSRLNWDLVTPLKEFEAGRIDEVTLKQRTAEADLKAVRLCTRMHELALQMTNSDVRARTLNFTSGLLQRHRGISMIIEGYVPSDESKLAAGSKLFEDGRRQVLESVLQMGDPKLPEAQLLKRVLEAYQPTEPPKG
jgi:hypothetical protein